MPELAEVETVLRTLEQLIKDQKIIDIDIKYQKIITGDPESFKKALIGQHFRTFHRRGKYLIFEMDDICLISHLRMEGKYYYLQDDDPCDKHCHVFFKFADHHQLVYHDTRKFGRMEIYPKMEDYSIFKGFGPEPFDERFSFEYVKKYLKDEKRVIKAILLDQSFVAGIGNIYADEILFQSLIYPECPGFLIADSKIQELIANTRFILKQAIEMGGTTIRSYTSSLGVTGRFQNVLRVHQRAKEPCPNCGNTIQKIRVAQRGTYICPTCQIKPYLIAITGLSGSGKSVVLEYLKGQGFHCLSCDEICHDLYLKDHKGYQLLKEKYPALFKGEELDKKTLNERMFKDKDFKKEIEDLIHPLIFDTIKEKIIQQKLTIVEVPLLFETDFRHYFAENLLVTSPHKKIIERLKKKGWSEAVIDQRLKAQLCQDEKRKLADYTIANNGTMEELYAKIDKWIIQRHVRERSI